MPSFSTLWLLNAPPRLMPRRSSVYGGTPRRMSHEPCRTGSSTRITCAPNDARKRVAPAPASWPERSQTLMCDRADDRPFGRPFVGLDGGIGTSLALRIGRS